MQQIDRKVRQNSPRNTTAQISPAITEPRNSCNQRISQPAGQMSQAKQQSHQQQRQPLPLLCQPGIPALLPEPVQLALQQAAEKSFFGHTSQQQITKNKIEAKDWPFQIEPDQTQPPGDCCGHNASSRQSPAQPLSKLAYSV